MGVIIGWSILVVLAVSFMSTLCYIIRPWWLGFVLVAFSVGVTLLIRLALELIFG